jgi:hypothetical protein
MASSPELTKKDLASVDRVGKFNIFRKQARGLSPAPGTSQEVVSVGGHDAGRIAPSQWYDDRPMVLFTRQSCIAVLLILLVSHAAVTLHVSTHVSIGQASCDYCEGYSTHSHAIVPATDEFRPSAALSFELPAILPLVGATARHSYRQRAPPLSA